MALCSFSNKPQDITKEIIKNIIIWNILRCVFLRNFFIFSPLYFSLLISYVFHQSYIRSLFILRLLCLYFVLLRLITPSFQKFHFDYEKNEARCGYSISKNSVFL
ncbi:hypothetical protein B1J93_17595 [Leptospira kirschneri serovar Pomona]|uniref:Uncharacterized protein n=1 Tax=Leptospira kirschneri serovar Pomona TaxID=561005 RepID=A0A1T1DI12_9LEPT|nr:hypothetical protein B1J93_17595 [Leptospira kirschneri serovar Pomona]